ncbi:MAG: manganese efflux pump MntP family protein [Methanomassiliicoccaceae archaeon]|nr:manganese efflux pump MntP family protein [Methanomassiliicoccaceae archaeon]
MDYVALILIAFGLAADAFAVAISNGMTIQKVRIGHAMAFGLMFGGMQAIMPILGFFLGSVFGGYIESYAYWVAFALLALIGSKMLAETFRAEKEDEPDTNGLFISLGALFILGVATSIDAFAVGVNIALTGWNIWISAFTIGVVTFALSFVGVYAGKRLGMRFQKNAVRLGGIVLIGIGVKILVEHLFF